MTTPGHENSTHITGWRGSQEHFYMERVEQILLHFSRVSIGCNSHRCHMFEQNMNNLSRDTNNHPWTFTYPQNTQKNTKLLGWAVTMHNTNGW